MKNVLLTNYVGPLNVIIHTLGGETHSFQPNLLHGGTLLDYLGHACAVIFTNLTTQLTIETGPEDWKIIRFSAEDAVLEVQQVGGKPLKAEGDDPKRLILQTHGTLVDPEQN